MLAASRPFRTMADELISLAKQYGTSMLRNAFALAAAINIEDGELEF